MNITDLLLSGSSKDSIRALAKQLDISEEQARNVVSQLAPTLARGMQHRSKTQGGLGSLLDALGKGNHSRYIEQPDLLSHSNTQKEGNDILGHIFGNKEVSRNVAKHVGKETTLGSTLIKKALPIVAAMVMGTLGKRLFSENNTAPQQRTQSSGILASLLDSDNDGSIIDDVLGMAFKAIIS